MKKRIASSTHSRGKLLLVAICVSIGVGAFAVQALGSFGKPRGFAVGRGPSSIVIGKFNSDAKRDIAVANSRSDNVSVLLGNGAGAFGKKKNFAAGDYPRSIATGNFNGDAKRDLAVANSLSGNVSILLGHGDGTFGAAKNFAAGDYPGSIAVGDFNNDTSRDLAVVNAYNNTGVSVLLGNGDGTFGPPTSFPAGISPASVVVGKFNADANLDLAVANAGYVDCEGRLGRDAQMRRRSCTGGFGTVSVLLGHGDGSFGAATDFPVGDRTAPVAIVVGNFNGDAKPDLALADSMQYSNSVSILLGKGAGAFGKAKGFSVFPFEAPDAIAVGDINQDSRDDLAVTSNDSEGVSVILGRGGGSFGAARSYPTGAVLSGAGGAAPSAVAIGNLNAGSRPDLAVAISTEPVGGGNRVAVLLNSGPSRRSPTLSYPASGRK